MKIITAGNLPDKIISNLEKCGFKVYPTCKDNKVLEGLSYHPDMQMAKVGDNVICTPNVHSYLKKIFENLSYNLICGKKPTGCNYPDDVAYNIKVAGGYVFHNFKYTDGILLSHLDEKKRINVSQGYAGCSICMIGENALITADSVIYREAKKNGFDVLLIDSGNIVLEGFDYGFIGGASFYYDGTVYFYGDVGAHPQYTDIRDFCIRHKAEIYALCDDKLSDFGSAVTFG